MADLDQLLKIDGEQGWAYSGGEYTVAVGEGGTNGVFVETAKADFNTLFKASVGDRP